MGKQHRIKRTAKQGKNKQPPPPKTTAHYRIAVDAYENEDYNGALKAIQNFQSVNRNTVFYHHAEAFLQYKLATKNEDFDTVRNHINEAAISASRAADLCGNSIILGHFCASMHYILACLNDDYHDYDGVIQQCERTLAIKDAKKPDRDSFIFKDLSQEMKIKKINQELTEMMKQCRNKKRWVPVDSKKRFTEFMSEIKDRLLETNNRIESASKSVSLLPKVEDRRKKQALENVMANFGKQQNVKSFWSKMCPKEKRKLFEVSIEDLKTHLRSFKDHKVMDLVLEALDFYRTWKTWKFWECIYCCIKFGDWESYMDHLYDNHGWDIPSDVLSFLPPQVDDVSVEIIVKGDWKPVNTDDLIKVMVKRLLFRRKCDKNLSSVGSTSDLKWPSCNDSERTNLLAEVHAMLQLLLRCKCLMQDHVDSLIELTIKELKLRALDSHFRNVGMKNLKLVCFLASSQLWSVRQYLQSVADSFGLRENPEIENSMDEQLYNDWDSDMKEKVVLSDDFLYLLLDDQLGELNLADYFDFVASIAGSDKILSQLYTGKEVWKELETWTRIRGNLKGLAEQFFDMFELERLNIVHMSEERLEHGKELSAVEKVASIFAEEIKRREKSPQYVVQTYASLLRKLQMELEERTDNAENNYQCDLDFISNILEKDQTVTAYQLQIKTRMEENLNLSDDCLGKKISLCKDQLSSIVCVDNATIMQSIEVIKQYGLQIGEVSACDYRLILVPILKSLIQLRLEDLVHKESKENSEANMHALLKELDAEKKINEERNNMRQQHGQSTDNKKKEKNKGKKDDAQVKDFKGTESAKKPWLPQKEADQDSSVPSFSDYPVLDTGDSTTADEQQENEVVDKNLGHQMQSPVSDTMHGSNSLGPGLENNYGDNNCFLNVIIQSLQHLRTFHKKFMSRTHEHVGRPCVVCALRYVFIALHKASMSNKTSVSPLSLRKALSHLHANEANNIKNFQMGKQNDPLEALQAILQHLQKSYASGWESLGSASRIDFGDTSNPSLVDEIFGMKIKLQINHVHRLIHEWSISQIVTISAEELRDLKSTHGNHCFDELVKLKLEQIANMQMQGSSDSTEGDGRITHANVTDWLPPDVIIIGCHILKNQEVSEVLNNLSTTLTISIDSQGLDSRNKYILFSLVFFQPSGSHYTCFIRTNEHERCIWYNDTVVEDIGSWDDVFMKSIENHMQPHTLLFKTKILVEPSDKDTTQKSDAETEYLSAEHAPDTKNNINEVCDNVGQNKDEKNKAEAKRAEESKATGDSENFEHHQTDAEDNNPNSEICKDKKLLEENSEYQIKSEAKGMCTAKGSENIVESLGENDEGVSATNSNGHENNNENRLQADIKKAVRLSIDSYERQIGTLLADVKDGTTPQSDVYQYVIMQSQWRLRQLRNEFMSGCEQQHQIHDRNHCFHSAYLDSLAALRIASRDGPNEVFAMTSLSTTVNLPIDNFIGELPLYHFIEELNKQDQVDEGATEINVPESASELENQLAAIVMNIKEVLDQERQQKEANLVSGRKKDLAEKNNGRE